MSSKEFPSKKLKPRYRAIFRMNRIIMEDIHDRMVAHLDVYRKNLHWQILEDRGTDYQTAADGEDPQIQVVVTSEDGSQYVLDEERKKHSTEPIWVTQRELII